MKRIIIALLLLPTVIFAQNDVRAVNQVVVVKHSDTLLYSGYHESIRVESPDTIETHNDLSTVDAELFEMLPEIGQQVEKGVIYNYNGNAVMAMQSHTRTEHAPETVPALFSVYRADTGDLDWQENEIVEIGAIRTYSDQKYEALQKHQSVSSWTPVATLGVLWKYYQEQQTDDCEGVKEWTASDHWTTYIIGDRRVDGGALWEVKNVAYTYYQPSGTYGNFGWTKIKDCE
jgi:hypothetical protein